MSLEKILSTAFLVPMGDPSNPQCIWGLNTMLWGEPGIGKSDRVESGAAMCGLPVRTTYVPTCQPEDAAGSPFQNTSKLAAMLDSVIFTLDEYLADNDGGIELPAQQGIFEKWMTGLTGQYKQKPAGLFHRLVKGMAKVSRRYGASFSRIEPMLPGISDLILDGQGVWFLDEISSARPAVQGGFLGATLARRVGGLQLPPGIRIVAAGNPSESAAGGWDMEPPMANRWCHWETKVPSDEEWCEWLNNTDGPSPENIEDGQQKVMAGWNTHWPIIRGLATGYRNAKAHPLHVLPAEGTKERGRAWCSPRTFNWALRAWTTCRCLGLDDKFAMQFIEGCIGEAATVPLAAWVINADIPDPRDVLTNGWKIDKRRIDRCVAVYTSITNYVLARKDITERKALAVKAWHRLEESADANLLDLTAQYAKALIIAGLDRVGGADLADASRPVMLRLVKSGAHQMPV